MNENARHSDRLDAAAEIQEEMNQQAIAKRVIYAGTSEEFCVNCGAEIPVPRRLAVPGCTLCVACQAADERRGSFFGGKACGSLTSKLYGS